MKYTVIWIRPCEAELARIWTDSTDRAAIAAAADAIDALLTRDPQNAGE